MQSKGALGPVGDDRSAKAVDKKLGTRVRARRLELGISQERLAQLLGVTFQQVQKYEKGVNRIAASRLFDISSALEMPIAAFFEGLPSANANSDVHAADASEEILATVEGAELVKLFGSIQNPDVRRRVIRLVRAMVEGKD